jgi:hypothetical protein
MLVALRKNKEKKINIRKSCFLSPLLLEINIRKVAGSRPQKNKKTKKKNTKK